MPGLILSCSLPDPVDLPAGSLFRDRAVSRRKPGLF
jgi:hypothetical protein